jgi:hypothetical protein
MNRLVFIDDDRTELDEFGDIVGTMDHVRVRAYRMAS